MELLSKNEVKGEFNTVKDILKNFDLRNKQSVLKTNEALFEHIRKEGYFERVQDHIKSLQFGPYVAQFSAVTMDMDEVLSRLESGKLNKGDEMLILNAYFFLINSSMKEMESIDPQISSLMQDLTELHSKNTTLEKIKKSLNTKNFFGRLAHASEGGAQGVEKFLHKIFPENTASFFAAPLLAISREESYPMPPFIWNRYIELLHQTPALPLGLVILSVLVFLLSLCFIGSNDKKVQTVGTLLIIASFIAFIFGGTGAFYLIGIGGR